MNPKKLPLATLEESARLLTRTALADFDLTTVDRDTLVLGTSGFEGNQRVFELYVAGEGPEDARVISRAVIDVFSGAGTVEVFLPRKMPG
jgi:hypothetical protein